MKTMLLGLGAAICALTQGAPVTEQAARGIAMPPAGIQQAALSGPTFEERQQCILLAQQLVDRGAPQRSANIAQDELKAISDEICAE